MHSTIQPNVHVALRLPSDTIKVVQLVPNTTVSVGKYGSFQANQVLGRPYYLTLEILEKTQGRGGKLRIVSAAELHTEHLLEETSTPPESHDAETPKDGEVLDVSAVAGEVWRSNRETIDDPSRQKMSMDEIEALKRDAVGTGKEIVDKILQSHTALDQKTAFSLAKYTLRKRQKYMRRFTVLPLDVPVLTRFLMTEKDASKIMEIREEMLGLIGCWANVHYGECDAVSGPPQFGRGRWLVVDETGGLIVAAMAEKMGILYPPEDPQPTSDPSPVGQKPVYSDPVSLEALPASDSPSDHMPTSATNTITLIHPNTQPNLSLLSYFSFSSANPPPSHPLSSRLLVLSWLQLLSPLYLSTPYSTPQPAILPPSVLSTLKPSKRSSYYRKHRRWARAKSMADSTRAGNFDGLIIASHMQPCSILQHLVPLLAGGAQICIYSPNIEPLVALSDLFSSARRTAFLAANIRTHDLPTDDFPLDPTLLLPPTIQTLRARRWQVLPGRTHPRMMAAGGAEGYLWHAARVIPAEGRVEARGKRGALKGEVRDGKKRRTATATATTTTETEMEAEAGTEMEVETETQGQADA